jgi:arylsulfatase A-like enzyme
MTAAATLTAAALGAADADDNATTSSAPARRPNVILIVLDDLGAVDLGCYGATDLVTPNLDAIAASGVWFTQFYAGGPICTASRIAAMTGRYPLRVGMTGNYSSKPGEPGLPPTELTLGDLFKAAGYATGHVGKWHLGYTPATMPKGHGFDSSFGNMGGCIDNYSHFFFWDGPDRHDLWQDGKEIWREGQFYGDLMVDACHAFFEAKKSEPFFLYLAINEPHYPLQGLKHWREHYRNLPSPRSMYAASVSTLDELIGRVMTRLRELGLDRQTIIAFQNDHGHSTEDRSFGGGGNAGPYRGAKASLFEGGIRVPAMISWPGTLLAGQVRAQLVTGCDWMPTLAELAGVKPPPRTIDGKSFVPVIHSADAPSTHATFHWVFGDSWAVRDGGWKLIANPHDTTHGSNVKPTEKLFLSDVAKDPSEKTNVAAQNGDVVDRLTQLHAKWVEEMKA